MQNKYLKILIEISKYEFFNEDLIYIIEKKVKNYFESNYYFSKKIRIDAVSFNIRNRWRQPNIHDIHIYKHKKYKKIFICALVPEDFSKAIQINYTFIYDEVKHNSNFSKIRKKLNTFKDYSFISKLGFKFPLKIFIIIDEKAFKEIYNLELNISKFLNERLIV